MTYYQFIRLCLLLDAAGVTGISETIKNVIGSVKKDETKIPEKAESAQREKTSTD